VPFEAPLAWPLPLAIGSGSHEGHMLVGGELEGEVWSEKREVGSRRNCSGNEGKYSVFVFTGDSGFGKKVPESGFAYDSTANVGRKRKAECCSKSRGSEPMPDS
jgi:hypothetical protein